MSDPIVKTFPARKQYTNNKQKKQEGLAVPSSAKLRAKLLVWSKPLDISNLLRPPTLQPPSTNQPPSHQDIFMGGGYNIWKCCFLMKLNSEKSFFWEKKSKRGFVWEGFNFLK